MQVRHMIPGQYAFMGDDKVLMTNLGLFNAETGRKIFNVSRDAKVEPLVATFKPSIKLVGGPFDGKGTMVNKGTLYKLRRENNEVYWVEYKIVDGEAIYQGEKISEN